METAQRARVYLTEEVSASSAKGYARLHSLFLNKQLAKAQCLGIRNTLVS